jgi:hypothetical protein
MQRPFMDMSQKVYRNQGVFKENGQDFRTCCQRCDRSKSWQSLTALYFPIDCQPRRSLYGDSQSWAMADPIQFMRERIALRSIRESMKGGDSFRADCDSSAWWLTVVDRDRFERNVPPIIHGLLVIGSTARDFAMIFIDFISCNICNLFVEGNEVLICFQAHIYHWRIP